MAGHANGKNCDLGAPLVGLSPERVELFCLEMLAVSGNGQDRSLYIPSPLLFLLFNMTFKIWSGK